MSVPPFVSSPLYDVQTIDALLARLPRVAGPKEQETRKHLLAAKVSLLSQSAPPYAVLRAASAATGKHAQGRDTLNPDASGSNSHLLARDSDRALDLCETRCELVACYLSKAEMVLAESEALQVIAQCKKVVKLPARSSLEQDTPASHSTTTTSGPNLPPPPQTAQQSVHAARWIRAYTRALSALEEIDTQRGIGSRAERWRKMREGTMAKR
ncbi:hypothetical protein QFC19_008832 [Naganishia cerealis]|uniref:Uncharacterized protein n=1 Tax=Naganishia cerealis TaxID=610337 RepID=A0ACC2UYZ9_9TREE|nr:hypothetical protein QFC19_008832 [Naganishia cerealis]